MKKKAIIFIFALYVLQMNMAFSQISAGPLVGSNLSRMDDFSVEKQVWRPALYAGLYGSYEINDWFSVGIEAAWSEKSITYYNSTSYSAFEKLQSGLSVIYPELPDISDLFELITGSTGMTINDSAYDFNDGIVTFQYVEVPLLGQFSYGKFCIELGGYGALLVGAKTENTFSQDVPLFETFPPSNFEFVPFLPTFIRGAFPAMSNPIQSTSVSTSGFAEFDYGLTGGITYRPDEYLTLSLRYSHGLAEKLSPDLPSSRTHSVLRFSISYNIFGKVIQKPSFD